MKTLNVPITLVFLPAIFVLTNCNNSATRPAPTTVDSPKAIKNTEPQSQKDNFPKTEITSDSIYKNKNYKITLTLFDTVNNFPDQANTAFTFQKLIDGQYKTIYIDTIYCEIPEIRFENFTTDGIKSVLVKNNADVRSNWTYYLYLVDTAHDGLKKIKGFEEIKNPNYLPQYNLIDNYVISGKLWTSFYKIKGDSIKDFDVVVYDDQTDNGDYERDYKKALKLILAKEKNNR